MSASASWNRRHRQRTAPTQGRRRAWANSLCAAGRGRSSVESDGSGEPARGTPKWPSCTASRLMIRSLASELLKPIRRHGGALPSEVPLAALSASRVGEVRYQLNSRDEIGVAEWTDLNVIHVTLHQAKTAIEGRRRSKAVPPHTARRHDIWQHPDRQQHPVCHECQGSY